MAAPTRGRSPHPRRPAKKRKPSYARRRKALERRGRKLKREWRALCQRWNARILLTESCPGLRPAYMYNTRFHAAWIFIPVDLTPCQRRAAIAKQFQRLDADWGTPERAAASEDRHRQWYEEMRRWKEEGITPPWLASSTPKES